MKKRFLLSDFIDKANKIHNFKYDYYDSQYVSAHIKINIICKNHGLFLQTPNSHLRGSGCPICSLENLKKPKLSIQEIEKRFLNKGFILLSQYKTNASKCSLKCVHCGALSEMCLANVSKGNGCIKCINVNYRGKSQRLTSEHLSSLFIKNNLKLIDNNIDYKNNTFKHKTKCMVCNYSWETNLANVKSGYGCPECGGSRPLTTIDFIKKAITINGEFLYDYSLVDYKSNHIKIKIICLKCKNIFNQDPASHLAGHGCSRCANSAISKLEIKWLDSLNVPEENRQKSIRINNKRYCVDAFIPETNTIYEFFGDFWHGNPKKYNSEIINPRIKCSFGELYQKTMDRIKLFEENGYKVIYIWESNENKLLIESTK